MFADLDYLVLNDLSHYTSFLLEEVEHVPFNMIVANHFPVQVRKIIFLTFKIPDIAPV